MRLRAAFLLIALLASVEASAHDRSVSFSSWEIRAARRT